MPRQIPKTRSQRLAEIEAVIERCESVLENHDGRDTDLLRSRLSRARDELDALQQTPHNREREEIFGQLAHWSGNLDPLPQPRSLTPIERVRRPSRGS
ncbi:hypothetical protein [Sphingomicrobium clamense]|uniref:Uncharacterized protein n=1 Tax=Sphingomicrobium clamense TaxID=2851013 RepID=A0ABS6V5Q3_9SPHN|nr:hypothetical protein [Sphingomicrobium sp. B8]MBW0144680.1 hypothetical protein [Sphingomicrobium sp. B8]